MRLGLLQVTAVRALSSHAMPRVVDSSGDVSPSTCPADLRVPRDISGVAGSGGIGRGTASRE